MLLGLQIYGHSLYDAVMTYPQAVFLAKWAIWQLGVTNCRGRRRGWILEASPWTMDPIRYPVSSIQHQTVITSLRLWLNAFALKFLVFPFALRLKSCQTALFGLF